MGVNPVSLPLHGLALSPATSDSIIPVVIMMGISGGVMLVCIVLTIAAKCKARRAEKDREMR